MSDEVETMFSLKETPWHGKGVVLNLPPTAADAIMAAGLDWTISLREIFTLKELAEKLGVDESESEVTESLKNLTRYRAVIRDTDSSCLGVVTTKYHVLQNRDAFAFFDPLIDQFEGIYESAGSLFNGKIIWVLVRVPHDDVSIGKDDPLKSYLLLANGHAGRMNCIVQPTDVRVVCNNTLQSALGSGRFCSIRHTASMSSNLLKIQGQIIRLQMLRRERYQIYDRMKLTRVTDEWVQKACQHLFPFPADLDQNRAWSIAEKKQQIVHRLLMEGQGVTLPGVRGTVWWFYNAICEYVDHYSTQSGKIKDKAGYVLCGAGASLKDLAYNICLSQIQGDGEYSFE